jgi:serine/threonine-protein kinase HipA
MAELPRRTGFLRLKSLLRLAIHNYTNLGDSEMATLQPPPVRHQPGGFEDFCVLNARGTDEKYRGSYETSVMKRFGQFANSTHVGEDMEKLFALIVLNCALRNGDAHLKNFGIVYDDVQGEARLAPVYDLVTTSVYLPKDSMALTLNGTTQWASTKELQRLGETRMGGSPSRVRQILERIQDAIADTSKELQAYIKAHAEFMEIGNRMLQQWEQGVAHSLGAA